MSEETIPQMRDQIDSLTKSNSDLTKTNEGLVKENRGLQARDVFRDEGYAANHGDLYAASHPEGEITVDLVNEFADQFNLAKVESKPTEEGKEADSNEGGDGTDTGAPGSTALSDMSRGGSTPGESAGGATSEKMTITEWQVLMASDPVAGKEAQRQGRVAISKENPWGDGQPVTPGTNPYAAPTSK